jgi:Uma2 family endonuclease
MTIQKALDPIELYYQEFPEERDMTEGYLHRDLTEYLRGLLRWYYRSQPYLITANLVIYDAKNKTAPDLAVIKGVQLSEAEQRALLGWEVNPPVHPAPAFVLEVSSKENWNKDTDADKNRARYQRMGVSEYFACDPLGYWGESIRLKGWRYQKENAVEIEPDAQGWFWSQELGLWLAMEGAELRFYDENRQLLLTRAEIAERKNETARCKAEIAQREAEKERVAREALLEKLRARGIDPDTL